MSVVSFAPALGLWLGLFASADASALPAIDAQPSGVSLLSDLPDELALSVLAADTEEERHFRAQRGDKNV